MVNKHTWLRKRIASNENFKTFCKNNLYVTYFYTTPNNKKEMHIRPNMLSVTQAQLTWIVCILLHCDIKTYVLQQNTIKWCSFISNNAFRTLTSCVNVLHPGNCIPAFCGIRTTSAHARRYDLSEDSWLFHKLHAKRHSVKSKDQNNSLQMWR